MPLSATFGVFVALGAVLALLLLVLRVLKRFGPTLGVGRNRLPMEVVQRLPLGPKHTIAVVRVGERVLTVAIGDHGVQTLAEIDGSDRDAVLATSATPLPFDGSTRAQDAVRGVLAAFSARAKPAATTSAASAATAVTAVTATAVTASAATASASSVDAFRGVLGMALSSATKLAVAGLIAGSLVALPARAQTPAAAAPTVKAGVGRNTQAPALPGGKQGAAPTAPGATAPAPAAGTDAMVARLAPQLDLRVGGGTNGGDGLRLSGTVGVVIMMGLLTLLPTLVLMMTGFTRILIVLHFVKQAIGTQTAPPNHLVAGLALLLTGFVMAPTVRAANDAAIQPWLAGRIEQVEMLTTGVRPFRTFMLQQTRPSDLKTFVEMSRPAVPPRTADDVPLVVVMSAFVTSELRTAFQIGFALFLPFIIIDLVVSSVLMSMGMMMLPPAMIALPCKLLLFVLVDGWSLIVQGLVQSFKH